MTASPTVIDSISEEKATGAGIGYFITTKTVFTDQDGEEVGTMTFRVLKFIPANAPQQAAAEDAGGAAVAQKPTRIKPPMGYDNSPWWNMVNEDKIPIQKCNSCGTLHHPPRPMCHKCQSMDMGLVEASGKGTVHTYTVIRYPQFPGYEYPILSVLVDLEEGCRMISTLVDCKPEDCHIGMAVQSFTHEDEDGFKIPFFEPAG